VGLTAPTSSGFYDRWTELFQRGFGSVLQAGMVKTGDPPQEDPRRSILALVERAGLQDGDRVLDAGCGVGGPAIIIGAHYPEVAIEGVTNSVHQSAIARAEVTAAGLSHRVRVHVADYQQLPFPSGMFDQVLFFESTGYATDLEATYDEAHRVLRPGGRLYVKDVFSNSGPLRNGDAERLLAFDRLWGCVRSKTLDESVDAMTGAGFEVMLSQPMEDIGTTRFVGSMVVLDDVVGLRPTELGNVFLSRGLNPPIQFGEIRAVKPGPA